MGKGASRNFSKNIVNENQYLLVNENQYLLKRVKELYDCEYSIESISRILGIPRRETRSLYLEVSNSDIVMF